MNINANDIDRILKKETTAARWGPWFAGLIIAAGGTVLEVVLHRDAVIEHLYKAVGFWFGGCAFALTHKSVPVRFAWVLAIVFGSLVLHEFVGLPGELWSTALWGATICALSYVTGIPRRKCPACAEKISAEAVKCRYCGEALSSMTP